MPSGKCYYLSKCWPTSMLPYSVRSPQWVTRRVANHNKIQLYEKLVCIIGVIYRMCSDTKRTKSIIVLTYCLVVGRFCVSCIMTLSLQQPGSLTGDKNDDKPSCTATGYFWWSPPYCVVKWIKVIKWSNSILTDKVTSIIHYDPPPPKKKKEKENKTKTKKNKTNKQTN